MWLDAPRVQPFRARLFERLSGRSLRGRRFLRGRRNQHARRVRSPFANRARRSGAVRPGCLRSGNRPGCRFEAAHRYQPRRSVEPSQAGRATPLHQPVHQPARRDETLHKYVLATAQHCAGLSPNCGRPTGWLCLGKAFCSQARSTIHDLDAALFPHAVRSFFSRLRLTRRSGRGLSRARVGWRWRLGSRAQWAAPCRGNAGAPTVNPLIVVPVWSTTQVH